MPVLLNNDPIALVEAQYSFPVAVLTNCPNCSGYNSKFILL